MTVSDEDKQIIEVLGLEYSALRSDILHRSAARYSLLGVFLGVGALLVALVESSEKIAWKPMGLLILGGYVFLVALAYLDAGRSIGRLSNRIVQLEDAINAKMGRPPSAPLLVWERKQQLERGPFNRVSMGKRIALEDPPVHRAEHATNDE